MTKLAIIKIPLSTVYNISVLTTMCNASEGRWFLACNKRL